MNGAELVTNLLILGTAKIKCDWSNYECAICYFTTCWGVSYSQKYRVKCGFPNYFLGRNYPFLVSQKRVKDTTCKTLGRGHTHRPRKKCVTVHIQNRFSNFS